MLGSSEHSTNAQVMSTPATMAQLRTHTRSFPKRYHGDRSVAARPANAVRVFR